MLINISEKIEEAEIFLTRLLRIVQNCFIPLTTGGKISEIKHIEKLLKAGSEKF